MFWPYIALIVANYDNLMFLPFLSDEHTQYTHSLSLHPRMLYRDHKTVNYSQSNSIYFNTERVDNILPGASEITANLY